MVVGPSRAEFLENLGLGPTRADFFLFIFFFQKSGRLGPSRKKNSARVPPHSKIFSRAFAPGRKIFFFVKKIFS